MTYYVKRVMKDGTIKVDAFQDRHAAIKYYDEMSQILEIQQHKIADEWISAKKITNLQLTAYLSPDIKSLEFGEAKLLPIFKTQEEKL